MEDSITPHTLLVSVTMGTSTSRIYLIDYLSARTLMHVTLPFSVTKMLPAWSPTGRDPIEDDIAVAGGIYGKFLNPLVLGARGGLLAVLDLWFDHAILEDDSLVEHSSAELKHSLSKYDSEAWRRSQHSNKPTHPWIDATSSVIGPSGKNPDIFYYLSPKPGEFVGSLEDSEPVPKNSVVISAIHLLWPSPPSSRINENGHKYAPKDESTHHQSAMDTDGENNEFSGAPSEFGTNFSQSSNIIHGLSTPLVIVGFNFGTFQIWALDTLELIYCSPMRESRAAVTAFETQGLRLLGDQHASKLLLWVARGSIATTYAQQAHVPSISSYGISLLAPSTDDSALSSPDSSPVSKSDCLSSVVLECASKLPSTFDGDYYGQIWLLQALPCWESKALNHSSLLFAFETFPANLPSKQHSSSSSATSKIQPKSATKGHLKTNTVESNPPSPSSSLECYIFSTSSLRTDAPSLFLHPDQLLQLSMPYQLDVLQKENSSAQLLTLQVVPSSVQHYFPYISSSGDAGSSSSRFGAGSYGSGGQNGATSPAHVSFESIAITEDSIWQVAFSSYGQQLLNCLAEQGPVIFDRPELISPILSQLGRSIPSTEEEAHSLREEMFSLALHNNLSSVITDYVLESSGVGAFANLRVNIDSNTSSSTPLHQVLSWARRNYSNIMETVHVWTSNFVKQPQQEAFATEMEREECVLELRQAKRLLYDLYNVFKALIIRYQTQRTKWDAQEEAMQKDLGEIALSSQYVELLLWLLQYRIHLDFNPIKQLIETRRERVAACAANSPTAWDVSVTENQSQISNSSASKLVVKPRPFNASTDGKLLIDHIVATINVGSGQERQMQFPPENVSSLLDSVRFGDSMLIGQKHQVMYYLLQDVEETIAEGFAERVMITEAEKKLVRGIHAIDSAKFDESMKYMTEAGVIAIINDEIALQTQRKFLDAKAFPHALAFYRARQPPIDSLEASVLALYVLLCNGLISEAFFHVRSQSRTTLDSYDSTYLHTLLFHFLHHAYNNNVLKDVFQLPFDAIESDALKQYLIWNDSLSSSSSPHTASDLHLIFLLQRSRIADAVSWYHQHNENGSSGDKDRDNEVFKAHLVNNWIRTLPPIVRTTLPRASVPIGTTSNAMRGVSSLDSEDLSPKRQASFAPSSSAPTATPSKRIVSKLFSSPLQKIGSVSTASSRFAPAALGPALLSPTNPGRFAKSPALFRPTIVIGSPVASKSVTNVLKNNEKEGETKPVSKMDLDSSSARPSLFSDRDITANLIGSPARRILSGAGSVSALRNAANEGAPLSSTPAPPPHTIVSQDSLIHTVEDRHRRHEDDDDDIVIMEMPKAPISTPTKRVMDSVQSQAAEVRRQSKSMQDQPNLDYLDEPEVWQVDEEEDDILRKDRFDNDHMQVYSDEEEEEEGEEEEEEEEGEEEEEEEERESSDEESLAAIETASRSSRRSAASARSRISAYSKSSTRSASQRNAAPSRQSTAEISSSGRQSRRSGLRQRNIAQLNPLDTVSEEESSTSASNMPRGASKAKRAVSSSKTSTPNASTLTRRSQKDTNHSTSASTLALDPHHGQDVSDQELGRGSRRRSARIGSRSYPTAPSSPSVESAVSRHAHDDEETENEEVHSSNMSERPKRNKTSSRKTSNVSSKAKERDDDAPQMYSDMVVDCPLDEGDDGPVEHYDDAITASAPQLSTRRSSRLSRASIEPLGLHPNSRNATPAGSDLRPINAGETEGEEMSGETVRIRRSTRTKPSEKQTTTQHIASRTRSLRLKDRR